MEQDFETGIYRKNQQSREIGQIISSVNNIHKICEVSLEKRRRKTIRKQQEDLQITETTPNLVDELIHKMTKIHTCVEELAKVHDKFG